MSFSDLALSAPVLAALDDVGYESPSPIQAATIPHILGGADHLLFLAALAAMYGATTQYSTST